MDFGEKLQELRKQNGLTQEELAQALYVSRTAVSKWESGRGYPSIDSIKAIAKFFSVTIDRLLSGEQLLTAAEEDNRKNVYKFADKVFGLLDISMAVLLFLPLFAHRTDDGVYETGLLFLKTVQPYRKTACLLAVTAAVLWGVVMIVFNSYRNRIWNKCKIFVSIFISASATILFILCLHPYAAVYSFVFLTIKAILLMKK